MFMKQVRSFHQQELYLTNICHLSWILTGQLHTSAHVFYSSHFPAPTHPLTSILSIMASETWALTTKLLALLLLPQMPVLCTHLWHTVLHMVTYLHVSLTSLQLWGGSSGFSSCLLFSRCTGHLVPSSGIADKQQYLCSGGLCRLSPCQHGCDQTHDSVAAMSLGDLQRVQWFGMSQERDHKHLLGKIYLSAEIKKKNSLWLSFSA